MDIAWENPQANQTKIENAIRDLPEKPDLFVVPEMFLTGFSCELSNLEKYQPEEPLAWLKKSASKTGVSLIGSLKITENSQLKNRLYLVEPDGNVQHYDKRHLFRLSAEAKNFAKGEDRPVFKFSGWKIFPQVCYDLRFPVWSRNKNEYDLLINVANWPASRRNHWRTLLTARAIENQAYVVGVNRVGKDGNGLEYSGDSLVLDPLGNILFDAEKREGAFVLTLDQKQLFEVREKFPFLQDQDQFSF